MAAGHERSDIVKRFAACLQLANDRCIDIVHVEGGQDTEHLVGNFGVKLLTLHVPERALADEAEVPPDVNMEDIENIPPVGCEYSLCRGRKVATS